MMIGVGSLRKQTEIVSTYFHPLRAPFATRDDLRRLAINRPIKVCVWLGAYMYQLSHSLSLRKAVAHIRVFSTFSRRREAERY